MDGCWLYALVRHTFLGTLAHKVIGHSWKDIVEIIYWENLGVSCQMNLRRLVMGATIKYPYNVCTCGDFRPYVIEIVWHSGHDTFEYGCPNKS